MCHWLKRRLNSLNYTLALDRVMALKHNAAQIDKMLVLLVYSFDICSDSFDIILTMCHIITTLLITLISNMFQNSGKFQLLRFTKTLFATPGTLQFVGQFLSAFLCARPWGKGQRKILLLANLFPIQWELPIVFNSIYWCLDINVLYNICADIYLIHQNIFV